MQPLWETAWSYLFILRTHVYASDTQIYSYNHDSVSSSLPKLNSPECLLEELEWINYGKCV